MAQRFMHQPGMKMPQVQVLTWLQTPGCPQGCVSALEKSMLREGAWPRF